MSFLRELDESRAKRQGRGAFLAGAPLINNPYGRGSDEREEWKDGWHLEWYKTVKPAPKPPAQPTHLAESCAPNDYRVCGRSGNLTAAAQQVEEARKWLQERSYPGSSRWGWMQTAIECEKFDHIAEALVQRTADLEVQLALYADFEKRVMALGVEVDLDDQARIRAVRNPRAETAERALAEAQQQVIQLGKQSVLAITGGDGEEAAKITEIASALTAIRAEIEEGRKAAHERNLVEAAAAQLRAQLDGSRGGRRRPPRR